MFTVLDSHFPPTWFVTAWPNCYTERQGEGIVDDVTLWNASYYNACIVALVSQAAYKAQVWAQLVFVLPACFVLAIQTYQRSNDGNHPRQSSSQNQYHPTLTTSPRHQMSQSFWRLSDTWCSTLPTRHQQWWIWLPPKWRQETPPMHAQPPPPQH
jgi:hypothetical protein